LSSSASKKVIIWVYLKLWKKNGDLKMVIVLNYASALRLSPLSTLQFRFTLLSHAACEAPLVLELGGFNYGEKCIFVANDWHAGLVPVYF
jgi:glycogen synthase